MLHLARDMRKNKQPVPVWGGLPGLHLYDAAKCRQLYSIVYGW